MKVKSANNLYIAYASLCRQTKLTRKVRTHSAKADQNCYTLRNPLIEVCNFDALDISV